MLRHLGVHCRRHVENFKSSDFSKTLRYTIMMSVQETVGSALLLEFPLPKHIITHRTNFSGIIEGLNRTIFSQLLRSISDLSMDFILIYVSPRGLVSPGAMRCSSLATRISSTQLYMSPSPSYCRSRRIRIFSEDSKGFVGSSGRTVWVYHALPEILGSNAEMRPKRNISHHV